MNTQANNMADEAKIAGGGEAINEDRTSTSKKTTDEQFMRDALHWAKMGAGWVDPNPAVGCVIVRDGKIIGSGYHTRYGCAHAEVEALKNCARRAQNAKTNALENCASNAPDPATCTDSTPASFSTPDPSAGAAKGATAYVTLEPCSHTGKQPPCTQALIAAGIRRVVVGQGDPNPLVSGQGIEQLRRAGVQVDTGVLQLECEKFNRAWRHFITNHTPYVIMKYAMTANGSVDPRPGERVQLTGAQALTRTHYDRMFASAIMVGAGTAKIDDPMLTCRYFDLCADCSKCFDANCTEFPNISGDERANLSEGFANSNPNKCSVDSEQHQADVCSGEHANTSSVFVAPVCANIPYRGIKQPLRIVLSASADVSPDSKLVKSVKPSAPVMVIASESADEGRVDELQRAGVEVVLLPCDANEMRDVWQEKGANVAHNESNTQNSQTAHCASHSHTEHREQHPQISWEKILQMLGERGIVSLIVEGGPTLHKTLVASGYVDEVQAYVAGKIFCDGEERGDSCDDASCAKTHHDLCDEDHRDQDANNSCAHNIHSSELNNMLNLENPEVEVLGRDVLITWSVVK